MYTFGTVNAGLAHDVAHTDCWIQIAALTVVFSRPLFKRRILRNWSKKISVLELLFFWGVGGGCYVVCVGGGWGGGSLFNIPFLQI